MAIDRLDQLPLPNLQWYAGFSGLGLFYAIVYALTTPEGLFTTLSSDAWCLAALLNMGCCGVFLLTSFIYSFVFGKLQNVEHQHMRDKFWNFVFYKFIFVFGVMNVQEVHEMLWWCVWFAGLGTLMLTEQLCKDRFQFLSFSPNTPASSHAKIITLLSMVLLSCAGLFMICAVVGWQYGFNHFSFLYSEVFILFARDLHTIIRYIIHLWDMHHDGTWENRSTYIYNAELVLELAALSVDFLHHVHMLLWANMFLSVASLILLMKLRFLYQEIQRRLKRHRNYVLVNETLEKRFTRVPTEELLLSDEVCAICWEKMKSARKLPCGHIFHMGCLRSWLEQDTVCPTCRRSLSEDLRRGADGEEEEGEEEEGEGEGGDGRRSQRRRMSVRRRLQRTVRRHRNWLLHFNGASIASWLPTFSLEVHQEDDPQWIGNSVAQLHREAQHIHSMFPHTPLQAITLDLADTHSVSLTVERILSNSIYIPGHQDGATATPTLMLAAPVHSSSQQPVRTPSSSHPEPHPPHLQHSTAGADTSASENNNECSSISVPHAEESESIEGSDLSRSSFRHESVDTLRLRRPHVTLHQTTAQSGDNSLRELVQSERTISRPAPTGAPEASHARSGPSVSPLTDPSSVFSLTALQRRKEELLMNARRRYLMKQD